MKLTVVMDNMVPFGASKPFVGEHGYSLLIEAAGKTGVAGCRAVGGGSAQSSAC